MRKRKGTGRIGRLKKGEEQLLISLFSGDVKIESLDITWDVENKVEIIKGKPVMKEIRTPRHFGSGFAAYAYHVLKGDTTMLRDLAGKLYADKKYVEGAGENGAFKIEIVRSAGMPTKQPVHPADKMK